MNDQFKLVGGGNFIEFRPSGDDFKTAAERSEKMGVLANSYTRGAGRMTGMLGEIAVDKFLGEAVSHCGEASKQYDLITKSGISIEVKTKKSRSIQNLITPHRSRQRNRICLRTTSLSFSGATTRASSCGYSVGSRRTRLGADPTLKKQASRTVTAGSPTASTGTTYLYRSSRK